MENSCPECYYNKQCAAYNRKYTPKGETWICVGRCIDLDNNGPSYTEKLAEQAFRDELAKEE